MPAAARKGDSVATGHGCDATTTILGTLQTSVRINGLIAAVQGDILSPHTILSGGTPPTCIPHTAYVNAGSSTVRFEGIAAARVGDSADAGSITGGSSNVSIGG